MTAFLGAALIYWAVFGLMFVVVKLFSGKSWGWSANVAAAITTGAAVFFIIMAIGIQLLMSDV